MPLGRCSSSYESSWTRCGWLAGALGFGGNDSRVAADLEILQLWSSLLTLSFTLLPRDGVRWRIAFPMTNAANKRGKRHLESLYVKRSLTQSPVHLQYCKW